MASFSDWPVVENGMLKFRDYSHLNSYFDFLDESTMCTDSTLREDTSFVFDKDQILADIENSYSGFTSLRSVAYETFEAARWWIT